MHFFTITYAAVFLSLCVVIGAHAAPPPPLVPAIATATANPDPAAIVASIVSLAAANPSFATAILNSEKIQAAIDAALH
jgi:hypothetical protein